MQKRLLVLFLLSTCYILAQESDWSIGLKYKNGFLIAHRTSMSHLPESHTNALEASVFFQTRGKKNWHAAYAYPIVGASALITSAGNKDVLGTFSGIYSFLQFKVMNREKSKVFTKIGAGVGYASRVYDVKSNPKNVAISSHFNALINLQVFYQYAFKKNELSFGLDLTHFSNGASKLPNLGVNLPYLSLGYNRKITETVLEKKIIVPINKEWKFSVIGILSSRGKYPTGEGNYPVYALSLSAQKAFSYALGYESGFDLMYKTSLENYKPVIPKSQETLMQFAWYHEYFMSLKHLQVHVGMGVYLRDEYFADDRFYHRFGFKYTFDNGLLINLTLKSHWAKADYVEYGIGYRF